LRPDLAADPAIVARFRSEARTAARLHHSNVASVYAFEEIEGRCLLVMEFVRGQTLDKLLRESGPMPVRSAVSLIRQVLAGIGHAHSKGIAHRDIKPANVFVTHDGVAKVLDFGIARILGTARQTREGRLIGTFEYMAPERILDKPTDLRSDIYSLGILLYEMLAGKLPFEGQSDFELMRSQIECAAPKLEELGVNVPAGLQSAVHKCIEKDPNCRFQTVDEFDAAIAPFENAAVEASPAGLVKQTRMGTASELAGLEAQRPSRSGSSSAGLSRNAPGVKVRMAVVTPLRLAVAAVVLALGGLGWVAIQKESVIGPDNSRVTEHSAGSQSNASDSTSRTVPTESFRPRQGVQPNSHMHTVSSQPPKVIRESNPPRQIVRSPGPGPKALAETENAAEKARRNEEAAEAKAAADARAAADVKAAADAQAAANAVQVNQAVANAKALARTGKYAPALDELERALRIDPENSVARAAKAEVRRECLAFGMGTEKVCEQKY
jgi:serine/threonine protein kinase